MDKEALKKSVNLNLRCVTQSCKGGVPLNRLEKDYKDLIGKPIPINDLGYNSIELFLRSIPDVVRLKRNTDGQIIVEGVADASTAHIANLISRQKSSKTGKATSKKPSLQIRKYSCHESFKSLPRKSSLTTSAGVHKQDNKASVLHPERPKISVIKHSKTELINSSPKMVASTTKSLNGLQPLQNNSHKPTSMLQGMSQPSTSTLTDKGTDEISKEALVSTTNIAVHSALSLKQLSKRRTKMRKAARKFIEMSKLSLTDIQLQEEILECQKLGMTTEQFLEWLKENFSASTVLNSSILRRNQDPAKSIEQLSKEKQKLKSLTLRNLWNVTFRFNDGILLCHLPGEYKTLFGTPIPYKDLGYKSLKAFIQDIPDVIRLKMEKGGEAYAEAVRDTVTQTSRLAHQQKDLPSTSNESINYASQSGWETSSSSSSNTSKIPSASVLKTTVERSLESIQSVLSSFDTIASIPSSPSIKDKPVLPSYSQAAPSESVSSNELNSSKFGHKPTLNSFPKIKCNIASAQFNSLLLMNFLLYGDDSFMEILKRGILAFDGFPFSKDSDQWNQKQLFLSMLPVDTLQECLKLLCIECDSNNKQVLLYKLMQFLSSPNKALSERKK